MLRGCLLFNLSPSGAYRGTLTSKLQQVRNSALTLRRSATRAGVAAALLAPLVASSAHAQAPLSANATAQLAAVNASAASLAERRTSGTLSLVVALKLARTCASGVAPETLLSVVKTESGFNPLAIGDNTDRRSYAPATLPDAVALATRLVAAGHSLDLGIAQINTEAGHLQARGLPLSAVFDACTGLRVGSEVLTDCYRRAFGVEQARLRQALSCYNTGTLNRGAGYAARVWRTAAHVVPAIQLAGDAPPAQTPANPEEAVAPAPRRPPPRLEDALHATPPVSDEADKDEMGDALHHSNRKVEQ